MSPDYIPSQYWQGIHDAGGDERTVGYPNLARSINRARYDVERANVARALDAAGIQPPDRVLDVGSGTGIWIDFWRQRGAQEIVGVDLAGTAVARLRARYPGLDVLQGDVSDPDTPLPREMDIVSAMSVLLHIVDDRRFEQGLRNLAGCVRAGGALILVEPAVAHRWWGPPFGPQASSKARNLADYGRVLNEAGLTIVDVRPVSCLLVNVIDTRWEISFRLMERYWDWLSRLVGRREHVGQAVGPVLRAADLVATKIVSPGPSAKIIVARADRSLMSCAA
jgi:SAM-dependent methyltransferase